MTRPPKRLVLFGPGLREPGGMAKRTRLLARSLAQRGWDVRVVSRSGTCNRFRMAREGGVVALDVPGFNLPAAGGLLYLVVAPVVGLWWGRRAHSLLAVQLKSTAVVAALVGWALRRPYVALTTSTGELSEVTYVTTGRLAAARRFLLSRAAVLIAQTKDGADELRRLVPAERIAVVPSPVVIPRPTPPLDGLRRAAFSGRLSAEKDLPTLLRVWERVTARTPDAHLTLVGSGGRYRSVEQDLRAIVAASPALQRSVRFTGWVSEEAVACHLASADVYVFPSSSEGMSNSLLEACALGRVVVASDIQANVAVLGRDYPLLYRVGDAGNLETAIRAAFEQEQVRIAAREQALAAASRSSVDQVVDTLERLLDESADHPRHQ